MLHVIGTTAAGLAGLAAPQRLLVDGAARQGGDRQHLHEVIRQASVEAARRMKEEGLENDLLDRLRETPEFAGIPFDEILDATRFVGRAPNQVDRFLEDVVAPIRERYGPVLDQNAELRV